MAIIIKKNNSTVFVSGTGIITNSEKMLAEKLSTEIKTSISSLELTLIRSKLLTNTGVKKDALQIWYKLGKLLNQLVDKYQIRGSTDEPYFWQSIYDYVSENIQKKSCPKRSGEWRRNHFRLCAKLAERKWELVRNVGPWSVWRDLFDNKKLLEDGRVLNIVAFNINKLHCGHKELRPYIQSVRFGLKKVDTTVLSIKELEHKLNNISLEVTHTIKKTN